DKLREAVGSLLGDDGVDEVASHVGTMLGLRAEDVADRHALFYSARRFVEALGAAQPTVLVFQDLHWADPSLLDLIELVASRVEKTPLLLLTLARPELQTKRPGWGAAVQASSIVPLEPLDGEHSRQLAASLLARSAAEDLLQ